MKHVQKFSALATVLVALTMLLTAATPFAFAGTGSASGSDPLSSSPMSPLATGTGSLLASTFFGSGGEVAVTGTATAEDGTVYVTGYVAAGTLPTTSGAYDRIRNSEDGFVARFSADLGTLLASTYIGGSSDERCAAVALGYDGSVYVTGYTASSNFPTTSGAYDRSHNGGISDVFVSRFAPDLKTLTASTYLGGSDYERPTAIAVTADRVVVAGNTYSSDFPIVSGAYDVSYNGNSDGFVSALDLDLSSLEASTFIGSPGDDSINALAVFDGKVYFTGSTDGSYPTTSGAYDRLRSGIDAFVTSMPLSLSSLAASTYLGGSNADYGNAIAVDSTGIYVAGSTASSGGLTIPAGGYDTSYNGGVSDGFVSKFGADLRTLTSFTFLGGNDEDKVLGLLVSQQQVFVVGQSYSTTFPAVDAYASANSGGSDVVVAQLNATLGSLVYSTYLGGANDDAASAVALTSAGGIMVAGFTKSSGFPIVGGYDASYNGGANGQDGFLARFDIGGAVAPMPVADFSADVVSGDVPLTVHFTDQSTGSVSNWTWDFDGDEIADSYDRNSTYTYYTPGIYTVSLTVSNFVGSDMEIKTNYITVNEQQYPPATDFNYINNGTSITIIEYTGPGGDVVIPGTIEDLPVTTIRSLAFVFGLLTSVTIPDSVTAIGNAAFRQCSFLTAVNIGSGVTSIGDDAFYGCPALVAINIDANNTVYTSVDGVVYNKAVTTAIICPQGKAGSLVIPSGVISIGDYAFWDCHRLTSVIIPDSVTSIGTSAFYYCYALGAVEVPNSVTSIGTSAFARCTALTTVNMGSGVTSITSTLFTGDNALTTINVDADNTAYKSIGGVVYNKDQTILMLCPPGRTSVTIPYSVITIGDYAFWDCHRLTSVIIPNSVTSIGTSAFQGCDHLTSVTIGSGVESIGTSAFQGCTALTSVVMPGSVTTIFGYAFRGCDHLTSVTIGSGVESIGQYAFYGCYALTSVTIPDSVITIGHYAFLVCTALTSVTIGSGVTSIGTGAFRTCTALTAVVIPDSVTNIGASAFASCDALISVSIGRRVESIGQEAFRGCTALTSVIIPDSVTTIGMDAFLQCGDLTTIDVDAGNPAYASVDGILYDKAVTTLIQCPAGKAGSVTIPSSVITIGNDAFWGCYRLTSVTISDSVTSIGNDAFLGCTALTSVTIPDSVTSIGNYAFIWCESLTSVTIGKNVTSIGDGAFCWCTSLTSVTIPDGVTSLGKYVFQDCAALTTATIGNGVTSLGSMAFGSCTALATVTIGSGVTTIGDGAFGSCTALATVTIGSGVTTIGQEAFYYCPALTSMTFQGNAPTVGGSYWAVGYNLVVYYYLGATGFTTPTWQGRPCYPESNPADFTYSNSGSAITITGYTGQGGTVIIPHAIDGLPVTVIGDYAFYGCTSLASVDIPDSVTSIGQYAFRWCTALATVTIGSGVTTIGSSAFDSCTALATVTIGSGVTTIGQAAFYYCTALTSMTFRGNAPTVGSYWAQGCANMVVYYREGATGFTTPTWQGVPCYPIP